MERGSVPQVAAKAGRRDWQSSNKLERPRRYVEDDQRDCRVRLLCSSPWTPMLGIWILVANFEERKSTSGIIEPEAPVQAVRIARG